MTSISFNEYSSFFRRWMIVYQVSSCGSRAVTGAFASLPDPVLSPPPSCSLLRAASLPMAVLVLAPASDMPSGRRGTGTLTPLSRENAVRWVGVPTLRVLRGDEPLWAELRPLRENVPRCDFWGVAELRGVEDCSTKREGRERGQRVALGHVEWQVLAGCTGCHGHVQQGTGKDQGPAILLGACVAVYGG